MITEPLFYCDCIPVSGETAPLSDREQRHIFRSRRIGAGDLIRLTDGRGTLATARVAGSGAAGEAPRAVIVERHADPAPSRQIHLFCALPRGERMAVMLDMATQLGITAFSPLECRRSAARSEAPPVRWRRVVAEACKQSRRSWFPALNPPVSFAAALELARESRSLILVADAQRGESPVAGSAAIAGATNVALLVGPEGGLTPDELELATDRGARFVRLGDAVLRIETAAVAGVALLAAVG